MPQEKQSWCIGRATMCVHFREGAKVGMKVNSDRNCRALRQPVKTLT